MSANKNTLARYDAIDKCLNDDSRSYFIEDLIKACVLAVYGEDIPNQTITKRTIYKDLAQLETVYHAPIEREKIGHRSRIYYSKPFSIYEAPMTKKEARLLRDTLSMLSRFKGMPQFEWIDEMSARLEENFQLDNNTEKVVSFENNPYLIGMEYFTPIFKATTNHKVIEICYEPYGKEKRKYTIHPYYLKQYNNRWFLFGLNNELNKLTNIALDRICGINDTSTRFIPNENIDFDEYFDDVIGVSINTGEPRQIILEVNNSLMPYIDSKPIHSSQTIISRGINSTNIRLTLIPNYEFRSLLLSFGSRIKIIAPEDLRISFKTEVEAMMKNYL